MSNHPAGTGAGAAAPGFDTDLDLSRPDDMTEAEAEALTAWYETAHGDGQGDLTPFVSFFIEHRPGALKLYRSYARALDEAGRLPQLVVALLFLHYYMARGNERGVVYEVVAARQWGATKREVLETIEMTFVESGPLGGNAAASSSQYLRDWDETESRRVADPWPRAWLTHPVDSSAIGSDSAIARVLGAYAPGALRALEERLVHARAGTGLPSVMAVLYDLHSAVADGRPAAAKAAAELALAGGLSPSEVCEVIGFGALYAPVAQLEEIAAAVEPVLAHAEQR